MRLGMFVSACRGDDCTRKRHFNGKIAFRVPPHRGDTANTKRAAYLEPDRDYVQKPIGGLSVLTAFTTKNMLKSIYKGAIVSEEHNSAD